MNSQYHRLWDPQLVVRRGNKRKRIKALFSYQHKDFNVTHRLLKGLLQIWFNCILPNLTRLTFFWIPLMLYFNAPIYQMSAHGIQWKFNDLQPSVALIL